jgi:hypothetical protein
MPGRRCYQRERALHAAQAPDRQRHLHDLLTTQLPHLDRALVGRERILAYLHDFGLRQRNGRALSWRMILRWRRDHGFPVVRGVWHPNAPSHPASRSPALSTSFAVTAWILTQFSTDSHGLFRVFTHPTAAERTGSCSTTHVRCLTCCSTAPGVSGGLKTTW